MKHGDIIPQDDRYIVRHSSTQGYELYDRLEKKVLFYSGDRVMVMDEALKENARDRKV